MGDALCLLVNSTERARTNTHTHTHSIVDSLMGASTQGNSTGARQWNGSARRGSSTNTTPSCCMQCEIM